MELLEHSQCIVESYTKQKMMKHRHVKALPRNLCF